MRRLAFLALLLPLAAAAAQPALDQLRMPPGFSVSVYSDQVPAARELAVGDQGTVFVGSMGAGKVYALTDADHDGRAEQVRVVANDLEMPVGVAFHQGDLYISAVSRILVLRDIEQHLDQPPAPELITDKLPSERHHGWKFIAFGPDNRLYVPVGAPCNICDPKAPFARILSMKPDGSDWQTVAQGVRNSVGFDWQPGSGKLWFSDNGRDLLGDDLPSDELNRVDRAGQHFGYPYCHQGDTLDPVFGRSHACKDYVAPVRKLGAHVAALGLRFYTGTMFPARYRHALFVAEHGSWNRSKKSGYRVMAVFVNGDRVTDSEVFLEGFLQGQRAWGRPVDVQGLADGSLLISDDRAGAVYRIRYTPPKPKATPAP
ncbi:MAG TPA: PQQ-dependent sugar dehydrogenase [Rhodanobacteraceae bacterium]|nr:PQQ-dependent sugar dehydrogenase [Rhodanobacteraceae bacterium]